MLAHEQLYPVKAFVRCLTRPVRFITINEWRIAASSAHQAIYRFRQQFSQKYPTWEIIWGQVPDLLKSDHSLLLFRGD